MKGKKIFIVAIAIFVISSNVIAAKEKIKKNPIHFKEELYFNKQTPVEINPGTNLESIFYFNKQIKNFQQPLAPVKGKYNTHLKIPKANLY